MPYQKSGGKMWYTRVVTRDGRRKVLPTGTQHERTARAVEAWLYDVRQRLDRTGLLDAIVDRRISLAEAFALGEEAAQAKFAAEDATRNDTPLAPLLNEWVTIKRNSPRGAESADDYLRQITTLFPVAPFLKSHLTVPRIAAALDALPVSNATRNRYRAALSGFCKWLVRRGTLETNPAREAGGFSESAGREVWYDRETAERVIRCIVNENYRAREAMMCGTGMDWSDVSRLLVRDVDLKTLVVRCRGSKTKHRDRAIRITEGWTVPFIRPALAHKLPDALVFDGGERVALKWHHRACEAAKATDSTLHDWRHTYAVNALRNGLGAPIIAHQLGHSDANMIWKRYGRFVPSAADYTQAIEAGSATDPATYAHSSKEA